MTLNFSAARRSWLSPCWPNGNAQFIGFDASGGAGTIGSGTIEKADATLIARPE